MRPFKTLFFLFWILIASILLVEYELFGLFDDKQKLSRELTTASDCARQQYPTIYQFSGNEVMIDNDLDHMDDDWELQYNFDPGNADDAFQDADLDGFPNADLYPGVIEISSPGFDCFYIAEVGLISDDDLLDILIHDPGEGFLPAIRDFVLVQQSDHSFIIEDALNFSIPKLNNISSSIVLAEINADYAKDLVLINLSEHIPGVHDQIVFAPFSEIQLVGVLGPLPYQNVELTQEAINFFFRSV